ncbi:nuclear transport factor 2 family protein [Actinocatenispora sera]|uniref:nuclear transport factor 2 family protein n=1 Tax=Actinocatenispora sera TaxID=390989 RepID=UPI0033E01A4B
MSETVVVRYRTREDAAAENRRLVEAVFAQLRRERPPGLEYTAMQLDGAEFVHVATTATDPVLPGVEAFGRFQRDLGTRLAAGPEPRKATLLGTYRPAGAAVPVAVAFVEAFGRRDLATVTALLHDDVVFESPRTRLTGAAAVAAAIGEFAEVVTGVDVVAAYGDEDSAVVCHDLHTGPFGTVRTVDHVSVRGGRIAADTVVFDTAQAGR